MTSSVYTPQLTTVIEMFLILSLELKGSLSLMCLSTWVWTVIVSLMNLYPSTCSEVWNIVHEHRPHLTCFQVELTLVRRLMAFLSHRERFLFVNWTISITLPHASHRGLMLYSHRHSGWRMDGLLFTVTCCTCHSHYEYNRYLYCFFRQCLIIHPYIGTVWLLLQIWLNVTFLRSTSY